MVCLTERFRGLHSDTKLTTLLLSHSCKVLLWFNVCVCIYQMQDSFSISQLKHLVIGRFYAKTLSCVETNVCDLDTDQVPLTGGLVVVKQKNKAVDLYC